MLSNVYHSDVIWKKLYQPLSSEEVLHTEPWEKQRKKEKMEKRGKSIINPNLEAQKHEQFIHDTE